MNGQITKTEVSEVISRCEFYKPCPECGGYDFRTIKTEYYDMVITIINGEIKELENIFAQMQPDEPFGMLCCKNCKSNMSLDDLKYVEK